MLTAHPFRFAVVLVALFPATAPAWDSCKFTADRSASLDTSGAARIEIAARAGDLELRRAAAKTISAQGRACASSEAFLSQINVRARREGDAVRVHVEVPDPLEGFNAYAWLDLTIDVPAGIPVTLTDSSGDLTVDGIQVVHITDSSGDIVARNLTSDVEIRDSSGDIRVENASGRVQINDSSGDITVHGAREVVVPSDSSGSIQITQVKGDVRIENDSSGDITVSDVGGGFDLLTDSSGDVDVRKVAGPVHLPAHE